MESLRLVSFPRESEQMPPRRRAFEFPHWVRITIRILSTCLCIIIAGLLIHTLVIYNQTQHDTFTYPQGTVFPAWPRALKLYPTKIMLSSSIIAAVLNGIALIALFGCFTRIRLSSFGPIATISSTSLITALWAVTVVYYKLWDTRIKSQHDIWSWTCSHKDVELREENNNIGFDVICQEMQFTFVGGVNIAALEGVNLYAIIWNVVQQRREKNKARFWDGIWTESEYKPVTVVQV